MMTKAAIGSVVALGLALGAPGLSAAADSPYKELNPGGVTSFQEDIDVNVVLVGIEADELGAEELPGLLESSAPVVRYKRFYGLQDEARLGLAYSFRYHHVFAGPAFEAEFASYLTSSATPHDPTLFQEQYNDQVGATQEITSNKWIDAPETEAWLAAKAEAGLGIDPSTPTVFFIDASRIAPSLGNHTYVKLDTTDPDTGYNFGEVRASRKLTAWGGTPGTGSRVWFYDLSAGPEGWSDNWNVDDADLDGDGAPDYRIPPIWHYTGGTRAYNHPGFGKATLAEDLGKVTRYVATNLLFASSPLYPPYFTANRIPDTVELDLNVVEWWNNVDVSARFLKPTRVQTEVNSLPAGPTVTVSPAQDLPFSGDWSRCYQGFAKDKRLCYNDLQPGVYAPFADLFLSAARNRSTFLDKPAGSTYEAALIGYGVGTKPKNPGGLLGFADDNWLDGTQSGVFGFVYPDVVAVGYGMTTTMIHEYGHHSSMSHPHDGYDPKTGDYDPSGRTQFAWLGDMSHTIMSYMDLATDFGQFDRDNSARHHAAGYAKIANAIAAKAPGKDFSAADQLLVNAQEALTIHNYDEMLALSKEAYESVVATAGPTAVSVLEPSTWTLAGPVKPGNGNRTDAGWLGAKDLNSQHNVKRVYSK